MMKRDFFVGCWIQKKKKKKRNKDSFFYKKFVCIFWKIFEFEKRKKRREIIGELNTTCF